MGLVLFSLTLLLLYTEVLAVRRGAGAAAAATRDVPSRRCLRTILVISIVIVDRWEGMIFKKLYILYIIYEFHSIYENKNNVMIGNITHCSKCTIKIYYTQC